MRTLFGIFAVVVAFGCSGQGAGPEVVVSAPAPIVAEDVVAAGPADAAVVEASRAKNVTFGIVVAGNMVGELEPCG